MSTFKQKVEEIVGCYDSEGVLNCLICGRFCKRDRILAAYKEVVEGMPIMPNDGDGYCTACKEHLTKEMGE